MVVVIVGGLTACLHVKTYKHAETIVIAVINNYYRVSEPKPVKGSVKGYVESLP